MMGLSETGAVALLFAATYPERTSAVVAYGTFAGRGDTGPTYPWAPDPEQAEWLEDIERHWGRGVLFLDEFAGSLQDDTHYREWFAKLERLSASRAPRGDRTDGDADGRARRPAHDPRPDAGVAQARRPSCSFRGREVHRGPHPGCEVRRAPGVRPLAVDRTRGSRRGDPGVPHGDSRGRRAAPSGGDGHVRGHRRLDGACGRARGPAMGGSARVLLLGRAARARSAPRTRDRYGGRRVLRDLRRTGSRDPMRGGTHGACREARAPYPDRYPYGRVRTDGRQGGWDRGRHRGTCRSTGWAPGRSSSRGPCGTSSSARIFRSKTPASTC